MAMINITIDTDKKTIMANIDGQDIGEIEDVSAGKYSYTRYGDEPEEDRKMTSFSVSLCKKQENDDGFSYSGSIRYYNEDSAEAKKIVDSGTNIQSTIAGMIATKVKPQVFEEIENFFKK